MDEERVPDAQKEEFGEATLGDAQAEEPRKDPEMIEEPSEGEAGGGESGTPAEYTGGLGDEASEGGDETYGGDQDAEGTAAAKGGGPHPQEDQAEG